MLKFGMTLGDGEHGLGLVFESENLIRLQEGQPVLINLADVGLGFIKRKRGRGRILIAHTDDPNAFFEQVTQVTGLPPVKNPGDALYVAAQVHPQTRCWCALLNAPCICRG